MATVLFEGVFDQILLKTAKNDRLSDTFSNLRIFLLHILRTIGFFFEDNWIFLTFHRFLIYQAWISKNLAFVGVMRKKPFAVIPTPPPFIISTIYYTSRILLSLKVPTVLWFI